MRTAASIAVYALGAGLTLLALAIWYRAVRTRRPGVKPKMGAIGAVFSVGVALMLISAAFIRES